MANKLHGKDIKTKISINTCFHEIHVPCFMLMRKRPDGSFNCGICQQRVNCFLPIQPNAENPVGRKAYDMTSNYLNYFIVSRLNAVDVLCIFNIIFEAYVEIKGISRMLEVDMSPPDLRHRKRVEDYLKLYVNSIYDRKPSQRDLI